MARGNFKLIVEDLLITVEVYIPKIVNIRFSLKDYSQPESPILLSNLSKIPLRIEERADNVLIETETMKINVLKESLNFCLFDKIGDAKIAESKYLLISKSGSNIILKFPECSHFYGLGEGGPQFDRRGKARIFWNKMIYGDNQPADLAIPFLLTSSGCGLFFNDFAKAEIKISEDGEAFYHTIEDFLDLFFIQGDFIDQIAGYMSLTGYPPLPPKWALGYIQSTRHFTNEQEIFSLARTFRDKKIPCDAIIFLSTYGDQKGWNKDVGYLDFGDLWKNPKVIIDELHKLGFRVILHEYPVVDPNAQQCSEGLRNKYLIPEHPPRKTWHLSGRFIIDFTHPEAGLWWWNQRQHLLELGVDGWWLDGGEGPEEWLHPEDIRDGYKGSWEYWHNLYDFLRIKAFYEGERKSRPNKRPFLLSRSGFAGMQRFSGMCWSGDGPSNFESLKLHLPMGLNMSLSGVPYWTHDVGGFDAGEIRPDIPQKFTPELFIRWLQFGAFSPIFRAHGRKWEKRLPWSWGPEIESICRKYIELRYRLLPYNYTLAYEASTRGLPLMRPLFMYYPDDPETYNIELEYLWGRSILVAPVVEEGASTWKVYLPRDDWYDFWTGKQYSGGKWIEVPTPLDIMPIFIRDGSIIPMMNRITDYIPREPLESLMLLIYPKRYGNSEFTLYEDDGETNDYLKGIFSLTKFTCKHDERKGVLSVVLEKPKGEYGREISKREYYLQIYSEREPKNIRLNNAVLDQTDNLKSGADGWSYREPFINVQITAKSFRFKNYVVKILY
ncbi:MAG: glycoside hydrolase family 31 protein [Candidatus Bathyarchaeia archaeon]